MTWLLVIIMSGSVPGVEQAHTFEHKLEFPGLGSCMEARNDVLHQYDKTTKTKILDGHHPVEILADPAKAPYIHAACIPHKLKK